MKLDQSSPHKVVTDHELKF